MTSTEEENKEAVRRFYDEVNAGNFDTIKEFFDEGFTVTALDEDEEHGREMLGEVYESYYRSFPDLRFELKEMAGDADWVIVRYEISGTHEGEFMGVEPTGNTVESQGYNSFRFAGGKIQELHGSTSTDHILRQLGVDLPSML